MRMEIWLFLQTWRTVHGIFRLYSSKGNFGDMSRLVLFLLGMLRYAIIFTGINCSDEIFITRNVHISLLAVLDLKFCTPPREPIVSTIGKVGDVLLVVFTEKRYNSIDFSQTCNKCGKEPLFYGNFIFIPFKFHVCCFSYLFIWIV